MSSQSVCSCFLVLVTLVNMYFGLFHMRAPPVKVYHVSPPLLRSVELPKAVDLRKMCPDVSTQSQYGKMDAYLFSKWLPKNFKLHGTFIEIGAHDGKSISNTWWLEKCLGWSGLLIEGHPLTFAKCQENRDNKCTHIAVCDENAGGTVEFVGGVGDGGAGVIGELPPDLAKSFGESGKFTVPCAPFSMILKEAGVKEIDFWSLE